MNGLVYQGDVVAAELVRDGRETVFRYRPEFLANAITPVASSLPLTRPEVRLSGTAVPPFLAGLLPEGRRLTALQRSVKASVDDDLALLLAVGDDTIGDVFVMPEGVQPSNTTALTLPANLSEIDFASILTQSGVLERPRIAGVQHKASAQMMTLAATRRGERMLVKFTPDEYPHLVENEHFFLRLARSLSIAVVDSAVLTDRAGVTALGVKRFDRLGAQRFHVEDGTQALDRYPGDKYNVTFEEVADALAALTLSPVASKMNLMTQLLFAWLTGNADQHAKNISMMIGPNGAMITPVYDVLCTLFYPDLDPSMALSVAGSKTLTPRRFREAGRELGLSERILERIRAEVLAVTASLADQIETDALAFDHKTNSKVARQLRTRHRDFGA